MDSNPSVLQSFFPYLQLENRIYLQEGWGEWEVPRWFLVNLWIYESRI